MQMHRLLTKITTANHRSWEFNSCKYMVKMNTYSFNE